MADPKRAPVKKSAGLGKSATSARAPWGSITREQIVAAGIRTLADKGFEGVTIRALAAEMGVAPMSLYRHVRDKNDLLDEIVEVLLAQTWRPRTSRRNWKAWTAEAAERFRRFLVDQPAALYVYLDHPVATPTAVARMEAMIEVLQTESMDPADAEQAYAALEIYTIGFAALQVSRRQHDRDNGAGVPGRQVEHRVAACPTDDQFRRGVSLLLGGLDR